MDITQKDTQKDTKEICNQYLKEVSLKYSDINTSEYGYRTPFENFLKEIFSEIKVTNIDHDGKAVGGNKPDFVLSEGSVPLLYIEVKDIGVSLDKIEKSEQLARYYGYDNLVLTDYLEFRFYRNGLKYVEPISIASYDKNERTLSYNEENFELLRKTLIQFTESHKEPIKSGSHLAKIMGGKAYRIRENARDMLNSPGKEKRSIYKVYETMKKQLLHDMSPDDFADMYAQTLVYGLFVARFHDKTPDTFTRSEARDLVPASNPLLRHFFDHIAGADFDDRLDSIVDELCRVFSHSDISKLISNYYGTEKGSKDPVIHFYEDFLQEYDSKKRKEFGAYYTPLPVVKFIVKAVDHILEKDFKLVGGLANSSKNEKGHIVQVLDPATGTGTFLTETIKLIHERREKQSGNWGSYVLHEVLPRLFGFEIMIAPYTIAHLKMSMLLKETGFKYFNNRRLGIYLTNSLQEGNTIEDMFGGFGLAESISQESKEASVIKNEKPIMVVLGNPPYSVSSQNKGDWITDLIDVYKKNIDETNKNSLSDDYVKFIRLAEYFVEKNKVGIVAMITNNSFLDGRTHREMRRHLLKTFDKIYILDLHGNSKKKEMSPDGTKDENVFDIMQGVSINIFVKTNNKNEDLGDLYFSELYGLRIKKFEELKRGFSNTEYTLLKNLDDRYYFTNKDFSSVKEYEKYPSILDIFSYSSSGIKFRKDNLLVKRNWTSKDVLTMLEDLNNLSNSEIITKYNLSETKDWHLEDKKELFVEGDSESVKKIQYKPYDYRYTYYPEDRISKIIPRGDSRLKLVRNLVKPNIGLVIMRGLVNTPSLSSVFVTSEPIDINFYGFQTYLFPLEIYSENEAKTSNLKPFFCKEVEEIVGGTNAVSIFRYIYAILHNSTYRERYAEFLKIDFPRIPYPKDRKTFDKLVKLGGELIKYHLLEHESIDPYQISYLGEGDNIVEKPEYKDEKIYINPTQYFGNVSEIAWDFYIGGYQPAQKWLKDRKGKELTPDDIEHYSKMIIALKETDRLMKEIDKVSWLKENEK